MCEEQPYMCMYHLLPLPRPFDSTVEQIIISAYSDACVAHLVADLGIALPLVPSVGNKKATDDGEGDHKKEGGDGKEGEGGRRR